MIFGLIESALKHPRVPDIPDPNPAATKAEWEKYWKAIDDKLKAIKAIAQKYIGYDAVKLKSNSGLQVIVHRSTRKPGHWQASRLDAKGQPWGDTTYATMQAALEAELGDGYQIIDARKMPVKRSSVSR